MADTKKEVTKTVEKTATETSTTAPKKSNTGLIVAIILIVLIVLPALGFGAFWFFVGRKIDKAVDDFENGEVNFTVDGEDYSLDTSENASWPDSMPSFVPKFTDGTIVTSGRLGDLWTVEIEGATKDQALAYRNALAAAGWTVEENVEISEMISFGAAKDNYSLMLAQTVDEDGKRTTILSVSNE